MGFLDNLKKEERTKEEILAEFNIFEGIECKVTFPFTELKIGSHGGAARGAATLAFGIVGLAATSGVKHKEERKEMKTVFQVVDKGIVFKKAAKDNKDLRIPYENIVLAEINPQYKYNGLTIKLLENQDIIIVVKTNSKNLDDNITVRDHYLEVINQRAKGKEFEEEGWGLESASNKNNESEPNKSSLIDELERLANIYEKGLLTDEEFTAMKKKLIENN